MIEDYMPHDPLMVLAWRDCLRWAITYPPILDAFLAETGVQIAPLRTALDRLICEQSGEAEAVARQFIEWFNTNVWGDGSQPPEEMSRREGRACQISNNRA